MVWNPIDAFGLLNVIAFTFVQPFSDATPSGRKMDWYRQMSARVKPRIPARAFGPIWTILYTLISAAVFIFLGENYNYFADQPLYIAGFVLYLVNIILNKIWSPLFFNRRIGEALFVLVLIIGTGIGLLIVLGLSEAWWSFGLYTPYVLWCCIAFVLNVQFYNIDIETKRYQVIIQK
jgi:tryptophan-rich sensory protein